MHSTHSRVVQRDEVRCLRGKRELNLNRVVPLQLHVHHVAIMSDADPRRVREARVVQGEGEGGGERVCGGIEHHR